MTLHTAPWPAGSPCWVDLMVSDLGAATAFYGDVLGWTFDGQDDPDGLTYLTALCDGVPAAAIGRLPAGQDQPEPAWTTYLATPDIEATAAAATAAGAELLVPPGTADEAGRFAVLADPTGALVGLWQAAAHIGAGVTDVPGSVTWNELLTPQWARAKDFYAEVLGFTYQDMSGPDFEYASFSVDGRLAGGIGGRGATGEEATWLVYFKVADVDAAVATADGHGATVLKAPWDSTFGRIALLRGPAGERFALLADLVGQAGAGAEDQDEELTGTA